MRRKATPKREADDAASSLTPIQITVLEALLAGRTITESAEGVGISRATVHRWLKDDYHFQAEVNAARHALRQMSLARIDSLCERSIEVLREALAQSSDTRVALEVLKGCGILGGDRTVESQSAEVLEAEARSDRADRMERHLLFG